MNKCILNKRKLEPLLATKNRRKRTFEAKSGLVDDVRNYYLENPNDIPPLYLIQ